MAGDDKEVEKFEAEYKKRLFSKIQGICLSQSMIVQMTEKLEKQIRLDINFPNIGNTLNNKLVQLQQEFKKAGISMYSKKIEDYGELKLNGIGKSLVGEAVIFDLIAYTSKGINSAIRYQKTIDVIIEKKIKKIHEFKDRSQTTQFLDKMKNFFNPLKEEDLLYSQEEIQLIKQCVLDCIASDEQLWNYNLKDNIVSSITKEIKEEYAAYVVPELLEESVIPDLQQLGLADLIPELQRTLVEEYRKDLPDSEIYQISKEDMHLYVPDFNRETKHTEKTTTKELHKQAQMIIKHGETTETMNASLKQEGITLEEFSTIDSEVSAFDRQKMRDTIGKKQEENLVLKEDKKLGEEGGNISL